MITTLPERVAALPPAVRRACAAMFNIDVAVGQLVPPPTMHAWIEQQFGALDVVRQQTVVSVTNRLTLEGALFNPVRASRPGVAAGGDTALEAQIRAELADDMFADPLRNTPADTWGRVQGAHSVSASNIAKYAGLHGLVIFDEPHPLRFGTAEVRDYLDVAQRWLAAAHATDTSAVYPIITWNCLPKSGASLVHGHMQMALARTPFARDEQWRRAAAAYHASSGRDYIDDLLAIHAALGLELSAPAGVRAVAHLTPLRNREVLLVANAVSDALADALCATLRALIDTRGMRAFNVAVTLPPFGAGAAALPVLARLGDRGAALTTRNDLGAMELYATGCVTADPFALATVLQNTLSSSFYE